MLRKIHAAQPACAYTLLVLLLAPLPAVAAPHALTLDDIMALKQVSAPQLSPDGGWVLYEVAHKDLADDEERTALYMASTADGEVVPLTPEEQSAGGARFSPDGRYISYLAADATDEDAKTQLWTLDRRGGAARAYTSVPQGVSDYRWSPDGQRMLLVIRDMSAEDKAALAAKEAGEEPKPLPWVIDRLEFKRDRVGYLDRSRTHLYLQSERGGTPLQITFGDYDDSDPVWSPDGSRIAFVSNRTEEPDRNDNSDIWVVSADAAKAGQQDPARITTNPGADYAPAFSHDGRQLAYVTVIEPDLIWYATQHLAVVPASGGEPRLLTRELDRNVSAPAFSADDRSIWFVLEDSAQQHLAAIDLRSGSISGAVQGELSVAQFDLHPSGLVALTLSKPHLPHEVFLLKNEALRQLTSTNAAILDEVKLGDVRNITFPSADGTEIEGFITTPPDYAAGRRYPTLLRIHGGPVSQYDYSFNTEAQLFAANGYVVVMTNPRGSSGYGQDFSSAIFAAWGRKDFQDVMAGVDYAIEQGYADAERLGVGGWSYGGILTDYVITKSDRFEGAITGASEVLYIANYGHDHYQRVWEAELGLPWENRELWEDLSPFNDVENVTTPTLVMGGKEDWNVPINNSELLYQALKRRGIDTKLVVYPDQSHGFTRPSFIRDRYERYLDWYGRTVRGR